MPVSCCIVLIQSAGDSLLSLSMLMLGKARVARSSPRSSLHAASAAPPPSCRSPNASVVPYPATLCMPASCCLLLLRSAGDSLLLLCMRQLDQAMLKRHERGGAAAGHNEERGEERSTLALSSMSMLRTSKESPANRRRRQQEAGMQIVWLGGGPHWH